MDWAEHSTITVTVGIDLLSRHGELNSLWGGDYIAILKPISPGGWKGFFCAFACHLVVFQQRESSQAKIETWISTECVKLR
jgi:hypothetical protein